MPSKLPAPPQDREIGRGASKHKDAIRVTSKKRDHNFRPPDLFTCKDRGLRGQSGSSLKQCLDVSGSIDRPKHEELVGMWWLEDLGVMSTSSLSDYVEGFAAGNSNGERIGVHNTTVLHQLLLFLPAENSSDEETIADN